MCHNKCLNWLNQADILIGISTTCVDDLFHPQGSFVNVDSFDFRSRGAPPRSSSCKENQDPVHRPCMVFQTVSLEEILPISVWELILAECKCWKGQKMPVLWKTSSVHLSFSQRSDGIFQWKSHCWRIKWGWAMFGGFGAQPYEIDLATWQC